MWICTALWVSGQQQVYNASCSTESCSESTESNITPHSCNKAISLSNVVAYSCNGHVCVWFQWLCVLGPRCDKKNSFHFLSLSLSLWMTSKWLHLSWELMLHTLLRPFHDPCTLSLSLPSSWFLDCLQRGHTPCLPATSWTFIVPSNDRVATPFHHHKNTKYFMSYIPTHRIMCVCAKDASPIPMNFSEKHSNAFLRMRNDRALVTKILQKRAEVNPTHQSSLWERAREKFWAMAAAAARRKSLLPAATVLLMVSLQSVAGQTGELRALAL